MAGQKIRIRLKAYDHEAIDASARRIVETVTKTGARVVGPVPLPTEKNVYAVIPVHPAPGAVLPHLQPLTLVVAVLGGDVVALFALHASQRHLRPGIRLGHLLSLPTSGSW